MRRRNERRSSATSDAGRGKFKRAAITPTADKRRRNNGGIGAGKEEAKKKHNTKTNRFLRRRFSSSLLLLLLLLSSASFFWSFFFVLLPQERQNGPDSPRHHQISGRSFVLYVVDFDCLVHSLGFFFTKCRGVNGRPKKTRLRIEPSRSDEISVKITRAGRITKKGPPFNLNWNKKRRWKNSIESRRASNG